ncbi:multiple RNA-binding domain-containing protein 1 [Pancytospora epiphaga]|nr:multiple RNA-binding domain-containing protein 1 [Pancytospora epiphaga]
MRVVVKNLPKKAEEAKIKEFFSLNSKVTDIYMLRDGKGAFRRVCFIGYNTDKEAEEAKQYFNNCMFYNNKITVELAREEKDSSIQTNESVERRVSYSRTIFVRGLSSNTDTGVLAAEFEKIGKLLEMKTETKDGKMNVIVKFREGHHAVKALKNIRVILGMRVRVSAYNETMANNKKAYYNSLFFNFETIIKRTCEIEKIDKRDLVNIKDTSLGSRISLLETNLVNQTKEFLEHNNILLDFLSDERSKTCLILRNVDILGVLDLIKGEYKINLAPSRCLALLDFTCEKEAMAAYKSLNMRRYKNQIVYCEFAPLSSSSAVRVDVSQPASKEGNVARTNKIIVKNVPFQASTKELKEIVSAYAHVVDVRLPLKSDKTHRGFGFIILDSEASVEKALTYFGTSTHLYGRRLVFERAKL